MPRLAAEVAVVLNTSLDAVLAWPLQKLYYWHAEAAAVHGGEP